MGGNPYGVMRVFASVCKVNPICELNMRAIKSEAVANLINRQARLGQLRLFWAASAMLLLSVLVFNVSTTRADDIVIPSGAAVGTDGSEPHIECSWQLPDIDSVSPGIQYGQDDDPLVDPGFPCDRVDSFDENENLIGDKPQQPDGVVNSIQVVPNAEDLPEARLIENWAAVDHPNGIEAIDDVFWKIFHPDGTFKTQIHGTRVQLADSGDGPLGNDGIVDLDDLGSPTDEGSMFHAAHVTGQVSADAVTRTDWGFLDLVRQRQKDLWYAEWPIHKEQLCGEYRVELTVVANGSIDVMNNTLDIMCFYSLEIDFTTIDWGDIYPGGSKVLPGDTNFGSSQYPTVKNTGNSGMQVGIHFTKLLQQGVVGPKEITVFDAAFGKSASSLQWIDPIFAEGLNSDPFNPDVYQSGTAWFNSTSLDQVLCANEVGKLDLSLHPPSVVPGGQYAGVITVLANWAPGLCHNGLDIGTLGFPDRGGESNAAPAIISDGAGGTAGVTVDENIVEATDVETTDDSDFEGSGLTYSITGGADSSLFSIDPTFGLLAFDSAPDFESPADADTNNVYEVEVTVTDSGALTDTQQVSVMVEDVNEAPYISSPDSASVPEGVSSVMDVESTDPDGETENGGGLTYSITGGVDSTELQIDPDTGALSFVATPDFENPTDSDSNNVYVVEVTVTDAGGLTGTKTATVTVENVNEAPSVSSPDSSSVSEGVSYAMDVESTDPDGETENGGGLTYSITGGADSAEFKIDPDTGGLSFVTAPDFENPTDSDSNNVYVVKVTVTDAGGLTGMKTVTVTVEDVNEPPSITSAAGVSVAENELAVIDVASTDPEGETENGGGLSYSITGGADAAAFSIDSSTGEITFKSAPDFENPTDADTNNVYVVEVTVTDSGVLTGVQTISVTVTDVVENLAPSITSTDTASVPESVSSVLDVDSTDPEGETENGGGLSYSITGGADAAAFDIDPATGALSFNITTDFETPADADTNNVYVVEVTVTDSGVLTGVQTISVTVTDVVENLAPSITSTDTVSVPEGVSSVMDVASSDPEGETENGGGLSYSITGGADAAVFDIDPATGALSFNITTDFENPTDADTNNVYVVEVTVTDSGALTGVQTISVTVTDVVENLAPSITSTDSVNVPEGDSSVLDVDSSDPEGETENGGGLTYSITGGADSAAFDIDPATGALSFNITTDFEAPADDDTNNVYEVEVTVTDSGALTGVQTISVTVEDVDETGTTTSSPPPAAGAAPPASNPAPQVQQLALPLAPLTFSAEAGNGSIALVWTPAPGTVSGYRVLLDDGTSALIDPEMTEFTLHGLENGTEYSVQFRVFNDAGFSEPMNVFGLIPRTVPSAPHSLALSQGAVEGAPLSLTWLPGENGGVPITSYAVEVDFGTGVTSDSTDSTEHSVDVPQTALDASFRVAAINDAGQGEFSEWSPRFDLTTATSVLLQQLIAGQAWSAGVGSESAANITALFGLGPVEEGGSFGIGLSIVNGVPFLTLGDPDPNAQIDFSGLTAFEEGPLSVEPLADGAARVTLQLAPNLQVTGLIRSDSTIGSGLELSDLSLTVSAMAEGDTHPTAIFQVLAAGLPVVPTVVTSVDPVLPQGMLSQLLSIAAAAATGDAESSTDVLAVVDVEIDAEINEQLGTNVVTFLLTEEEFASLLDTSGQLVIVKRSEDGSTHSAFANCETVDGQVLCTARFTGEAGGFSTFLLARVQDAPAPEEATENNGQGTGEGEPGTPGDPAVTEPEPEVVTPEPEPGQGGEQEPQPLPVETPTADSQESLLPVASISPAADEGGSGRIVFWWIAMIILAGLLVPTYLWAYRTQGRRATD